MAPKDDRLMRLQVETHSKYWSALRNGFLAFIDRIPSTWEGSDSHSYRYERQQILRTFEPVYSGISIAAILFLGFRITGSMGLASGFLNSSRPGSGAVSTGATRKLLAPPQTGYYLERQTQQAKKSFSKVTQPLFDLMLSMMCGFSATLFLTNRSNLHRELAEIPLLPGKSLFYETVCPEVVKAYRELEASIHDSISRDETIGVFHRMNSNCHLRAHYISAQSTEENQQPDLVPYPGLKPK